MTIEFYKEFGPLGYLANYSEHGFTKNGIYYKTVEHYYQSEKFSNPEIKKRIINADTPKMASNIGRDRSLTRIANFKAIKLQVMYDGILEKFRQNREIAYKLIETRNAPIAEATIDEYYWGIGKTKTGANHIGQILVQVRERIKREILDEIIRKCQKCEVVYVIGHKNPDADSIFSSYLLSRVLSGLGVKAQFAILNKDYDYCKSDKKLIESFLPVLPIIVEPNNNFILVDHNTLEGLNSASVLGAIDHHIVTKEVYNTLEIEYSSTALLIYDLFKDIYHFNKEEKRLIALSVLADTEYLCSKARFKEEDQEVFNSLGIDLDIQSLKKEYFAINDFSMDIETNLHGNYKEYDVNGHHLTRSLIYGYQDEYDTYHQNYLEYIKFKQPNMVLIWCDFDNLRTYVTYQDWTCSYNYIMTSTNVILKRIEQETSLLNPKEELSKRLSKEKIKTN